MSSPAAYTIEELVDQVNQWCQEHNLAPANGQSADQLSTRTLRYYRTMGLLAGPISGGSHGYGELHRLQLSAIRVLQAQGLPLRRIQTLLYGRSENDLRKVLEKGVAAAPAREQSFALPCSEDWQVLPIDASVWMILRRGRQLTPQQLSRIHAVINDSPAHASLAEIETERNREPHTSPRQSPATKQP